MEILINLLHHYLTTFLLELPICLACMCMWQDALKGSILANLIYVGIVIRYGIVLLLWELSLLMLECWWTSKWEESDGSRMESTETNQTYRTAIEILLGYEWGYMWLMRSRLPRSIHLFALQVERLSQQLQEKRDKRAQ